jgi:uncharacterized protein YcfJ
MAENNISINLWKLSTIGLVVIGATAMATTFVVGQKSNMEVGQETKSQPQGVSAHNVQHTSHPTEHPQSSHVAVSHPTEHAQPSHVAVSKPAELAQPSQAVVEACNKYATDQVTSKTTELVKDGGIGAVLGAAVGAVGGAIADGGKGAGKGAAIGGIVGATGGTLYGVNENKSNDEKYQAAYASCMHSKGYPA